MSGGKQRAYIIDVPANYDANKPYRLFYASHGLGGRAEDVAGWNYFDLKTLANNAKEPAVFIAPQGIDGRWDESDHALFDDLTTFAKDNLCIDTTRVFVTGMSFGGMITYSLSTNHQKRFRAGVALAPANYVIWLPNPKLKDPIAWMQTTGMGDGTCPWVNNDARKEGSKYIALEKAADNGCKVPATVPTWQSGKHLCYDFEGCKAGYPVKACTFNGGHVQSNSDPGTNTNWIAQESWDFFTQF
jgi:poly(3-hydroxybutyrate) depolymerase